MLDFAVLAHECAPTVAPATMAAIVHVESTYNPYAIGVVGGRLVRQPRALDEAVATAAALEAGGWNFSVGLAQVNRYNLPKYKLTYEQAFEPCANLRVGSKILEECYARASAKMPGQEQAALQAAFSCYYSGNFTRGFRPDKAGKPSYVAKVLAAAGQTAQPIQVVPTITRKQTGAPSAPAATPPAAPAAAPAPLPKKAPPPADHTSVLVDLRPQREAQGQDGAEAPAAGEQAPVVLQPGTDPAPAAVEAGNAVTPRDVVVF